MVDKLKLNQNVDARLQNLTTSQQALKENFKTISSTLSVAQVSRQVSGSVKNSDDGATKLSNSLKDAVKYSKQALKVLEDITAGDLTHADVQKLLSSEGSSESVEIDLNKQKDGVSVQDLAVDLAALKENLSKLFDSLKAKANQSEVYSENQKASEAQISDLKEAQSKADATSMRIQFNSQEALLAHNGLTVDSVANLLSSGESVR